MSKIDIVFDHVRLVFAERFPTAHLWQRRDPHSGEVFFLVDDPDLFESESMQDTIIEFTEEFLWDNGIYNVYFAADSGDAFNSIQLDQSRDVASVAFAIESMIWSVPDSGRTFDLPVLKSAA